MDYQKIVLAGNTTADAEQRTSKSGEVDFVTFSVAVSDGKGRATYFPVTVFGEYGKKVAPYLTKGRQVLIEGRVEVGEQGHFNIVADVVRLGVPAREDMNEHVESKLAE